MRTFLVTFIIFLGIFSCTKNNYEKPNNLIGRSDMIDILTDLYISQQGLQMHPIQNEDVTLTLAKDAADIMKFHEVKYSDFQNSYQYYVMQPESFKEMLNEVKTNLHDQLSEEEKNRQKVQANRLEEENKKNQPK